jgi:hypothetical protein
MDNAKGLGLDTGEGTGQSVPETTAWRYMRRLGFILQVPCPIIGVIPLLKSKPVSKGSLSDNSIAIFTALNREEIKFFVRGVVCQGTTKKQITEMILHAGIEAGFAAAARHRRDKAAYAGHKAFMKNMRKG